jgi:HemY protein
LIGLLVRLSLVLLAAAAIAWLADRPGGVRIDWMGMEIETTLAAAAAFLAVLFLVFHFLLRLLRRLLKVPGETADFFRLRRKRRGFESLSKGFLAIGAGDLALARRHAETARRVVPDEPLTQLLDVQAAQLSGDAPRVLSLLSQMTQDPRTALLGLRGLHAQAQASGDLVAARAHAEKALAANPALPWASRAVIAARTSAGDWDGVLRLIDSQKRAGTLSATEAAAKRAVVMTAEAEVLGATDPKAAFGLALGALKIDPALVPAAIILCRLGGSTGNWKKAQKIAGRTFELSPHAGLAEAWSRLQPAASPAERLKRLRQLVTPSSGEEGAVALARAALAAREFAAAREALAPFAENSPRQRVASLMAAIAEGEGDQGLAREWLSRALTAPRDPQWTADGYVSESWLAASPVTGELGVFQWKVPLERIGAEPTPAPAAPPRPPAGSVAVEPALSHLPDDPGTERSDEEMEATALIRAEKLAGGS